MKHLVAAVLLLCTSVLFRIACSAQAIPAGTLLPVELRTGINSAKTKPGRMLSGKLAQDVVLPSGTRLAKGTAVDGRVLEVGSVSGGSPARIALVFDTIRTRGTTLPLSTSLKALASMDAVFQAQLPTNTVDDYGSSVADWNTTQVGGQGVYRRAGILVSGPDVVGKASMFGEVYAVPRATRGTRCTADPATAQDQSFWVFSSDACGTYGFEQVVVAHAGRSSPTGEIVLQSPRNIDIHGGSGWLLTVIAAPPGGSATTTR